MTGAREELSARLGYAANGLDRLANHRDDTEFVAALAADPDARVLLFAGDVPLLRRHANGFAIRFGLDEASEHGASEERVLLGRDAEGPVFAAQVATPPPDSEGAATDIASLDVRSLAVQGLLDAPDLGLLAQAKSLTGWHARHRFCANCGGATQAASAGWKRECTACDAQHFPRTDPVVIMLVVHGERCLLARQARFTPGMMSCLAGFVEPGETIEDAVRREVFEEAGIRVGRVRYLASQPWPFPSSLMIGCIAEGLDDRLILDEQELEAARWFTRDEVAMILEGRHPDGVLSPPPVAIAHHLERAFLEGAEP